MMIEEKSKRDAHESVQATEQAGSPHLREFLISNNCLNRSPSMLPITQSTDVIYLFTTVRSVFRKGKGAFWYKSIRLLLSCVFNSSHR